MSDGEPGRMTGPPRLSRDQLSNELEIYFPLV
jgi:hypothetical protein